MRVFSMAWLVLGVMAAGLMLSACNPDTETIVYGKAIAKLNQEAHSAMMQGDTDTAVDRLESAVSLLPEQPELIQNLAAAYHANGDYLKAAERYKQLIEAVPAKSVEWRKSLGISYEAYADTLKNKLEPSSEEENPQKLSPEARKELQTQIKTYYQEALTAYQAAFMQQEDEELEQHISTLQKDLADMAKKQG